MPMVVRGEKPCESIKDALKKAGFKKVKRKSPKKRSKNGKKKLSARKKTHTP